MTDGNPSNNLQILNTGGNNRVHISDSNSINLQRDALNESSKICRNSYLWFILISVYVFLVILATTDRQLLLQSTLAIPILNFPVPVKMLYITIPPLYVGIHFYTLLQLSLLVPKINKFKNKSSVDESLQDSQKTLLLPFVFNERILDWGNSRLISRFVRLQVILTLFVMPIFLTMSMLYRYLPMHDDLTTCYHKFMLVSHVIMATAFAFNLGFLKKTPAGNRRQKIFKYVKHGWISIPPIVLAIFVLAIPPKQISEYSVIRSWQDFLSDYIYADTSSRKFPSRNLIVTQENLTKIDDPRELARVLTLYEKYFTLPTKTEVEKDAESGLISETTSFLQEAEVVKKREQNRFYGVNLKGRDLRYADLSESVLINANIEGANFDHANLSKAVMVFAIGGKVGSPDDGLSDINPKFTRFNSARLSYTRLSGAYLREVKMKGAYLAHAQLYSADLRGAKLDGANLASAKLSRSNLFDNETVLNNVLINIAGEPNLSSVKFRNTVSIVCKTKGCKNYSLKLYDNRGRIVKKINRSAWVKHANNLTEYLYHEDRIGIDWYHTVGMWLHFYNKSLRLRDSKPGHIIKNQFHNEGCEPLYVMDEYKKYNLSSKY